jgi:Zn-dependent peptidase ImmA (M78 family)
MLVNHNKTEYEALRVLEEFDINSPVVDVAKIAEGKGIKIEEIKMPSGYADVAGFYDENEKTIYLDIKDPPKRKLFSIAHELGHIFLNHKHATVLYRVTRDDENYSPEESEANSFAAHLLMPEFMLRDYMRKLNLSKSDYVVLSNIFGTPISSMRYTLEHLK